jgi:hypothetical protein
MCANPKAEKTLSPASFAANQTLNFRGTFVDAHWHRRAIFTPLRKIYFPS